VKVLAKLLHVWWFV